MGTEVGSVSEAVALTDGAAGEAAGIGQYLAGQRRLRGISIDDLATLTRIPQRSLERLESGVFDGCADGFVRGFVRSVAEALGVDPDEAVMRLLREPEAPQRATRLEALDRSGLAGAVAVAAIALLVAALWLGARAWLAAPDAEVADGVILRRDPVRALAAEAEAPPAVPPAVSADAP